MWNPCRDTCLCNTSALCFRYLQIRETDLQLLGGSTRSPESPEKFSHGKHTSCDLFCCARSSDQTAAGCFLSDLLLLLQNKIKTQTTRRFGQFISLLSWSKGNFHTQTHSITPALPSFIIISLVFVILKKTRKKNNPDCFSSFIVLTNKIGKPVQNHMNTVLLKCSVQTYYVR